MSTGAVLILVACVIAMGVSGLLGALAGLRMIDDVNKTRPAGQRLAWYGWRPNLGYPQVLAEYQRLYPQGPLIRRLKVTSACGILAVAVAAGVDSGPFAALWFVAAGGLGWWFMIGRVRVRRP